MADTNVPFYGIVFWTENGIVSGAVVHTIL
jgi:hypothetical protein